jgi:hypothetical protein
VLGALAGVLWMLGGSGWGVVDVGGLCGNYLAQGFPLPLPPLTVVGSVSVADKAGKIVVVSMWFRG